MSWVMPIHVGHAVTAPVTPSGHLDPAGLQHLLSLYPTVKIVLLQAGIGTGKTHTVSSFRNALPAGKEAVVVTPRQALTREACQRYNLPNYQNIQGDITGSVGICANSLSRYAMRFEHDPAAPTSVRLVPPDLFVLEECEQLLRGLNDSTYKSWQSRATFDKIRSIMAAAPRTLLIDAHPHACTAYLLSLFDPAEILYVKGPTDIVRQKWDFCSAAAARVMFMREVEDWSYGQGSIFVFSQSESEATALAEMAKREWAQLSPRSVFRKGVFKKQRAVNKSKKSFMHTRVPNVLLVTEHTFEDLDKDDYSVTVLADGKLQTLTGLAARAWKADIFLASPKIGTGLDYRMQVPPKVVFGLPQSLVGTQSDLRQGMGRVRNGATAPAIIGGVLGGETPKVDQFLPETHIRNWVYKHDFTLRLINLHLPHDAHELRGGEYMHMIATGVAAKLQDGLHWTLLALKEDLVDKGISFTMRKDVESDASLNHDVKVIKHRKRRIQAEYAEKLPRLTQDEYEELNARGASTRKERAYLRWFNLSRLLGDAFLQTSEEMRISLLMEDRGKFRHKLMDFAHTFDVDAAKARDRREAKALGESAVGIQSRQNAASRSAMFRTLLDIGGIQLQPSLTPQMIDPSGAQAMLDWALVSAHREHLEKYGLKFARPKKDPTTGKWVPTSAKPMRFVSQVMRTLGVELIPQQVRKGANKGQRQYYVDELSLARQIHLTEHYRTEQKK